MTLNLIIIWKDGHDFYSNIEHKPALYLVQWNVWIQSDLNINEPVRLSLMKTLIWRVILWALSMWRLYPGLGEDIDYVDASLTVSKYKYQNRKANFITIRKNNVQSEIWVITCPT